MKVALEQFVDHLKKELGSELRSIVLYGSACENVEEVQPEEIQVLLLCHSLGVQQLELLRKPLRKWMKQRHPLPKLFTLERLKNSTDVFPIECLEIKSRYEVLFGDDIIEQIEVDDSNLRLQLETEFKGKLLQLRESYIFVDGKEKELRKAMAVSLGAFESLFRSLNVLLGETPNRALDELLDTIESKLSVDVSVFKSIDGLRHDLKSSKGDTWDLYTKYLSTMEILSDKVDAL